MRSMFSDHRGNNGKVAAREFLEKALHVRIEFSICSEANWVARDPRIPAIFVQQTTSVAPTLGDIVHRNFCTLRWRRDKDKGNLARRVLYYACLDARVCGRVPHQLAGSRSCSCTDRPTNPRGTIAADYLATDLDCNAIGRHLLVHEQRGELS